MSLENEEMNSTHQAILLHSLCVDSNPGDSKSKGDKDE